MAKFIYEEWRGVAIVTFCLCVSLTILACVHASQNKPVPAPPAPPSYAVSVAENTAFVTFGYGHGDPEHVGCLSGSGYIDLDGPKIWICQNGGWGPR